MVFSPRRGLPTTGRAALTGLALVLSCAAPATAQSVPTDQVVVTFKEAVGDRFVNVIDAVMGTSIAKKQDARHYTFHIGPFGNQNDFALFFAHLPYVQAVEPEPQLDGAEQAAPPVLVHVGQNGTHVTVAPDGSTVIPADNAGNGIYLSPDQLMGDHVLVSLKSEGPTIDLIDQVYGTHTMGKAGSSQYRISLPAGTNAVVAAHMFRICPYVSQAEPSYHR